jgi:hypothetical protein
VIQSFGRHFTYPHMTIAGEDLLVVMRASADTGGTDVTANYYVRLVSSSMHAEGQTLETFCIWRTRVPSYAVTSCVWLRCHADHRPQTLNMLLTAYVQNNHNSNAVSFHRIRRFRQYANVEWATYTVRTCVYTGMYARL